MEIQVVEDYLFTVFCHNILEMALQDTAFRASFCWTVSMTENVDSDFFFFLSKRKANCWYIATLLLAAGIINPFANFSKYQYLKEFQFLSRHFLVVTHPPFDTKKIRYQISKVFGLNVRWNLFGIVRIAIMDNRLG